jgi:hypothetical protein
MTQTGHAVTVADMIGFIEQAGCTATVNVDKITYQISKNGKTIYPKVLLDASGWTNSANTPSNPGQPAYVMGAVYIYAPDGSNPNVADFQGSFLPSLGLTVQ